MRFVIFHFCASCTLYHAQECDDIMREVSRRD